MKKGTHTEFPSGFCVVLPGSDWDVMLFEGMLLVSLEAVNTTILSTSMNFPVFDWPGFAVNVRLWD